MASKRRLSGSLLPQQTGTDGIDGHDGTDGIDGHDGTDGIDGHDGTDGIDGHDGTDGIDGHDGTDGIDGIETQSDGSSNSNVCLVCGDKARFINYGALACQSCKTFFRRNGFRPQSVRPCVFNNNCEVNMLTRHNCTACRLAKCLAIGMSSDLIRKEDKKRIKTTSSTTTNFTQPLISTSITTISQLITLNPFQNYRSFLLDSEWTLLSNIVHAYDTYNTIAQMSRTIDSLSTLPVEMHTNVTNPLEIICQMYTSMQSFIRSSPDFRILTLNEQTSLLERNLHGVTGFYSILFFRDTGILHNTTCMEAFINIYGLDAMLLAKRVNERLDPDSTSIILILLVSAFSSNSFIVNEHENMEHDSLLHGTFRLLGSQNVYVDLLGKYMIYRYGYNESIIRCSRLTQLFLCMLKNLAIIHANNETHRKIVADIIEMLKQSLTIDDNEQTPLWGKDLIV